MTQIEIQLLPHGEGLSLPDYATEGSAGLDLRAALDDDLVLQPGKWALIATGIAIALPPGLEAQVRPRSGLAAKNGVTVLNAPGTIDSDYRGEIKAILINHSETSFTIERGMKIAQMVIARYETVRLQPVPELSATTRGAGGFGSTGLSDKISPSPLKPV